MVMAVGVDGCPAGWFWVSREGDRVEQGVAPSISDLMAGLSGDCRVFIDIPIGLLEGGSEGRRCDREARRLLGPGRGSSVFPAPYRPVLAARSYDEAKAISQAVSGRMLSKQAWFITAKIRELDAYLAAHPEEAARLREVHPELAFWGLNGGRPLVHGKKSRAGFEERRQLLARYFPQAPTLIDQALTRYRRREVARDDIVDALVNLVLASTPEAGLRTVPADPARDSLGLAMAIVYRLDAGMTEARSEHNPGR